MDAVIQTIERRRWDILAERWRSYLPDSLGEMPGAFQAPAKDELLIDRMKGIGHGDSFSSIDDAPVIRTLIFEAARFCVERCLYFTRIAEHLAENGMPTAAVTSAYLSMIFGSRSLQGFLGIYYCFSREATWLIDIWPSASLTTSQGGVREWAPRIAAFISDRRIGHEHHWKLFIRLRSVTTRLPLNDNAMSVLRRLRDYGSFSSHRNDIQYNDHWPYHDLYQPLNEVEIGLLPAGWVVREQDLDHNLKIAQVLAFISARMLLDVLLPLRKFTDYCAEFRSRLTPDWHPLLSAGALSSDLNVLRGHPA
jgi:hypothetical protein